MSLIDRYPTTNPTIRQAEDKVNFAWGGGDRDYTSGIAGDHESLGSWFTSGLSGQVLSHVLGEESEKELYVKRNAVEYGVTKINETLEAFKELGQVRNYSKQEVKTIKELQARKAMIERDLAYAYDTQGGDLDASIDTEGNSFNDRWGVGDDEAGVYEFVQGVIDNPKYAAGILTGEILKDAPLSVLAWAGLTAKGAKGASAFSTLVSKINNIQPRALRGITKVAAPVGIGAVGGGAYEASYSALNEGKINWGDVESGTEFGAAFGILGSIGAFAKGIIPEQAVKAGKKVAKADDTSPTSDLTVSETIDEYVDTKEKAEISKFSESLMAEHDRRIFPNLTGNDYSIMNRAEAAKAGIDLTGKDGIGSFNRVTPEGKQTIVWGEKETIDTFNRLQRALDSKEGFGYSTIKDSSINHLKYLKDKNSYDVFQLAHEKAHVLQNKQGRPYPAHVNDIKDRPGSFLKEQEVNQMAFVEMDRVFKEHNVNSADKSAVAADKEMVVYNEGAEYLPKDYDEKNRGLKQEETVPTQEPNSQVMSFLEQHKGMSALGAALAAYGMTEGSDAPYMAAAGALATLGGPKAYRKLTEVKVPQEVAKARLQAAQIHEGLSVYAKNLEIVGQTLGDRITKRFPGESGAKFLEILEQGKNPFKDEEGRALVQQWKDWMNFLARQGAETGLFQGKGRRLGQTQLVSNYVSHIIRGKVNPDGSVRPLTNKEKEELIKAEASKIKIKGSSSTVHNIPRRILGTLEDLKAKGYAVVDDPAQVLSIYSQAMARTIHNRKLLSEFKQLDLGTKDNPLPAMFTIEEFDKRVAAGHLKKDEQLHYSEFDHPSLQGYKVHTNLKSILDDHFEISREGGLNDFAEGLLSLNNSLKRVFVFGSLFHGQALFMSSIYSLGLSGAVKGMFGKGKISEQHSWKDVELGSGEFNALAKEAIKAGLQIVNVKRQELVNPGKVELDEFLDKLGGFGVAGKKAFGAIDKVTWEYLHDRYKLAAYLRHKEVLMRKGMDDVTSGKKAAEFANDAFGSLDWNDFATRLYDYTYRNPGKLRSKVATKVAQSLPVNKRRWLNLGLFAPDWTISNIRIIGKTFTGLPEVSKTVAKRVRDGKWGPQEKEIVQAWNMYAAYATRAGFYTSGMWFMMMNLFSDEEPTMEGLGEFWGGETSGKLQLGGGESMVISKQIAEPIHWIQHPQHTLMNKASIVPKTMMEGMFNKQWFSMKKGFPMGPSIVDMNTGETHYGKWILGKGIPIVAKPLMQDDLEWQERFERTFTGFFGFPQYGKPED